MDVVTEKSRTRGGSRTAKPLQFSLHALLRFVERSSRVPVDMHYLAMLRRRHLEGIVNEPTDYDLIESIEKGSSLEKYRARLRRMLDSSRVIHVDDRATYRVLGRRLIAVMDRRDRNAVTVLTAELVSGVVPQHILDAEGVSEEEPYATLSSEEIMRSTGFLFTVERRRADRARVSHVLRAVSSVEPPVEILWGRGTLTLVVSAHSRDSIKALRKYGGLTVTPYIAEFSEIERNVLDEQRRFPEVDWSSMLDRLNYRGARLESVEVGDRGVGATHWASRWVFVAWRWVRSLLGWKL
jgi:hypothetical protein